MPRKVVVILPGQGAQQPRMGADLYRAEPAFTVAMDAFFLASGNDGAALREAWLAPEPGPMFDDCSQAQPLLFALGYALTRAVAARGIRISTVVGHSVGELAAAAAAGVFTIPDAGRVLAARTAAMARTGPGGMLAVAAGVARVREQLETTGTAAGIAVAAVNTPRQTVLSGNPAALAGAEAALLDGGVACFRVKARQPFHSPLCEQAANEFDAVFRQIELRPPEITIRSTCTGRDVTDEEAVTPRFWSVQLARPVLFWQALDDLLTSGRYLFLEAGPGGSCGALLRRHPAIRSGASVVLPLLPALPGPDGGQVFEKAVVKTMSSAG